MSNELMCRAASGYAVYATVRNGANGQIWNGAAFEVYSAGNLSTYAISLTQQGASGVFVGNMPSAALGSYVIDYRRKVGGSYAESDTFITDTMNRSFVQWSGSALISPLQGDGSGNATLATSALNAIWGVAPVFPTSGADAVTTMQKLMSWIYCRLGCQNVQTSTSLAVSNPSGTQITTQSITQSSPNVTVGKAT